MKLILDKVHDIQMVTHMLDIALDISNIYDDVFRKYYKHRDLTEAEFAIVEEIHTDINEKLSKHYDVCERYIQAKMNEEEENYDAFEDHTTLL